MHRKTAIMDISDCSWCLLVCVFMKKFAYILITVLVTGFVFVTVGTILFCWHSKRRPSPGRRRPTTEGRGTEPRGLPEMGLARSPSTPNDYVSHTTDDTDVYEELREVRLPESISRLGIPKVPDGEDLAEGNLGTVSSDRDIPDMNTLNPPSQSRGSYLTPTFKPAVNCPDQYDTENMYSIRIRDMGDPFKKGADPGISTPTRNEASDNSNGDHTNRFLWHTGLTM